MKMDAQQQNFVDGLARTCKTHDDWLTVMRFGLKTLLENQTFLIELIFDEAEKLARESKGERTGAEEAHIIFGELGLTLSVTG